MSRTFAEPSSGLEPETPSLPSRGGALDVELYLELDRRESGEEWPHLSDAQLLGFAKDEIERARRRLDTIARKPSESRRRERRIRAVRAASGGDLLPPAERKPPTE